jgi:hypothetical protein
MKKTISWKSRDTVLLMFFLMEQKGKGGGAARASFTVNTRSVGSYSL